MAKSKEELELLQNTYCTSQFRASYKTFKGFTLPEAFSVLADEIENFEVFDDDIWITSFPKCGTTWCQEMIWCIANNLDYEKAKVDLDIRFPFIEYCAIFDMRIIENCKGSLKYVAESLQFAKDAKRPRFIKTHLPWDLLPIQIRTFQKRPKIIHVARGAKDVCVSYFYHSRLLEAYTGDFDTFAELFLNDKCWTPFFDNILSYWQRRNESNILFIKFEDMKTQLPSVVNEVSKFMGIKLSEVQTQSLLKHISFDEMKKNQSVNHSSLINFLISNNLSVNPDGEFIRSGKSGGYKSEMNPNVIKRFDKMIQEKLGNTGLQF